MKTTLILVRHGESEANHHKIFAGWYDAPLHANGIKQAEQTAEYIAENYKIEKVYASDLLRAWRTGEIIAARSGVEIVAEPALREIRAGEWDGIPFDVIEKQYAEDFKIWRQDTGNSRPTGGESVKELGARVMAALTRLAEENAGCTIGIATHATPIRVMRTMIAGVGWDEMMKISWVSNASVTMMEYENGKWQVPLIGEDAHLGALATRLPANV